MNSLAQPEAGFGGLGSRRLEVVNRPLAVLKLDPKNPRLHHQRQVRQIARSLKTFGFNVPILVDAKLQVIAGHGSYRRILVTSEVRRQRLELAI